MIRDAKNGWQQGWTQYDTHKIGRPHVNNKVCQRYWPNSYFAGHIGEIGVGGGYLKQRELQHTVSYLMDCLNNTHVRC